jgi:hypothetical protein
MVESAPSEAEAKEWLLSFQKAVKPYTWYSFTNIYVSRDLENGPFILTYNVYNKYDVTTMKGIVDYVLTKSSFPTTIVSHMLYLRLMQ